MERRNLLKGIAAAAGALITGGGASAATLTVPNGPMQLAAPAGDDAIRGEVEFAVADPEQELIDTCVGELLKYRDMGVFIDLPGIQAVPLGTTARVTNVRRKAEAPKPPMPAIEHVASRLYRGQEGPEILERIARELAARMADELVPDNYIRVPYMLRVSHLLGPQRASTATMQIDICEASPWHLADILVALGRQPMTYLEGFVVGQLRGQFGPVPFDVYCLYTLPQPHVNRQAFMLQAFSYTEVFACYNADKEALLSTLTSVAPALNRPLESLACLPKDAINAQLGLDVADSQPGQKLTGSRAQLASLYAVQMATMGPGDRMLALGKLAVQDKVMYDVVYEALRQLRDAGLVQT